LAATALLTGCSQGLQGSTEIPPEARVTKTPTASAPDPNDCDQGFRPLRQAAALFRAVDAALAAQKSVHVDMGNVHPPPVAALDQAYGAGGDNLKFSLTLEPGKPPATILRTGGAVYVSHDDGTYSKLPVDAASLATTAPAAYAVLHTDVRKDFDALGKATVNAVPVGRSIDMGVKAFEYALVLDRTKWLAVQAGVRTGAASALGDTLRARLWLDACDRPIRLETTYDEKDALGAGTGRLDYSGWNVPVQLSAPKATPAP